MFTISLGMILKTNTRSKGFVSTVQLTQESVIPIVQIKSPLSLRLTEMVYKTHFFPLNFKASYCDAIEKENFTFYKEGTLISNENTTIYELYAQNNVSCQVQISVNLTFSTSNCPAVFVVFKDVDNYESFLQNGTWSHSYVEHCIKDKNFSLNMSLMNNSYYFWGIRLTPNVSVSAIKYHINVSGLRNSTSSFKSLCSITSPSEPTTACFRNFYYEPSDICVVGIVPKRTHGNIKTAKINYVYSNQRILQLEYMLAQIEVLHFEWKDLIFTLPFTLLVTICCFAYYYY